LHEIGHWLAYYEFLSRQLSTNAVMLDVTQRILRIDDPQKRILAVSELRKEGINNKALEELDKVASEKEAMDNLIAIGQWGHDKEHQIDGLKKDIHTIKRGLLDLLFNVSKLESARSLLRRAENALMERLVKRNELLQGTAESHAEICRQRFLIGRITETVAGDQLWDSDDHFQGCDDNNMIHQLCEIYFKRRRMSLETIRQIARSPQWRGYWEIAKKTGDIFENSIMCWSDDQRDLAYWSTIYDSVHEAYERPSKEIINDDDLLDSWFIRQGEKIDKKNNKEINQQPTKAGRNEQFIMSDKDGAKRVYDMNDQVARTAVKAKQKTINNRGSVKEQHMPDSQNEMRQQIAQKRQRHMKDITRR